MTADRVIIIGGGIIGASFAWHLSQQGIDDLLVISDTMPGDARQATSGTWGWVNGYADDDPDYAAFRLASLRYWPQLIEHIDGLKPTSKGAYIWDLDDTALPASIGQHHHWGHDVKMVDGHDLRPALPHLKTLPQQAGFGQHDLAIEGKTAARMLMDKSGAEFRQTQVKRLIRHDHRVTGVETDQGDIEASEIIVAAGLGTPALLNDIDIDFDMRSSLGLLAHTKPLPPIIDHPVAGVDFHIRQDQDGRLIIGGAFTDTADDDQNPAASAERLVQMMAARLDYDGDIELDYFTLGRRPLPMDGRPKIGRLMARDDRIIEGLYTAVMHSGVTNAPLAGMLGTKEILSGQRDDLLTSFAPQTRSDHPQKEASDV